MVIDTRTNQTADFSDATAVTVLGALEEVADHERQKFLNIYLEKHPYLQDFVESPTCALLRVKVKTCIMVSRFQNASGTSSERMSLIMNAEVLQFCLRDFFLLMSPVRSPQM